MFFSVKKLEYQLYLHNMSQRELADKIGVTEQSVSRYVHGTRTPRKKVLIAMAKAFGLETSDLMETEEDKEKQKAFHSFRLEGGEHGVCKKIYMDGQELKGVVSATVCFHVNEVTVVYLEMLAPDAEISLETAAVVPQPFQA